ncbi:hypothetical protein FYK55_21275 [Roseiconus nitratireducens]|uniref:Secreted protein n=1 Tax=Roseiconus nitratireducens TaxID=2605748 RepID=A0A5M6CY78_9BACT|nr:hypothetical protein [Roseiconus nitratireducens]KAA5540177.1 hypothetical protein FYK55_21275 [Roseiconus nitratireducens]
MKRFLCIFSLAVAVVPLAGCGSSGPTNTVENASVEDIQSYEQMIAEEEAAANAAMEGQQ